MKLRITVPAWATAIVSDLTDMARSPHPVAANRSSFALTLPDDVYFEYAFLDQNGAMRADPERPERADNPWYKEASAVYGPAYRASYNVPDDLPSGETRRLRLASGALAQTRRVSVYTPSGFAGQALPVVYVQDGVAFYRYAKLHAVLEALLRDGLARPAHLAFLEPVARTAEYGFNPAYQKFVLEEALPLVEREVRVTGERALLGASLGGLASVLLALEAPGQFRSVGTFSGAFLGTPETKTFYGTEDSWVLAELRRRDRLPLRFYTEVGTLEWLTQVNRDIAQVFAKRGYDYVFTERHAGHNWTNWKDGLAAALGFILSHADEITRKGLYDTNLPEKQGLEARADVSLFSTTAWYALN